MPRRFCTIIECTNAVITSHGINAEFIDLHTKKVVPMRDAMRAIIDELKDEIDLLGLDEEMGALNYMVAQRENAPVLWFENVRDAKHGATTVMNLFGTGKDRVALAMGLPTGKSMMELIQESKKKFGNRVPPEMIPADKAPVNEVILNGDDINLFDFFKFADSFGREPVEFL